MTISERLGRESDRPFGRFLRRVHERARPLELLHDRCFRFAELEGTRTRTASAPGPCRGRSARLQSLSIPGYQALGLRAALSLVARQRKQLAQLVVTRAGPVSGSGAKRTRQDGLAGAG